MRRPGAKAEGRRRGGALGRKVRDEAVGTKSQGGW